jgi:hypothetical protein
MEGRLDADELAQRVTSAYSAKFCVDLERLTADITPTPLVQRAGPPVFVPSGARTNGFAIASIIFALVWFAWMGSVAAVVCGHIALRQIRDGGGRQGGRGLAVAGLALGYAELLALVAAVVASI